MNQKTKIILELVLVIIIAIVVFLFKIEKYRLPDESRIANLAAYTKNKVNEIFHEPEEKKKYFGLSKQSFVEINKLDKLTKEGIPEEFDKGIRSAIIDNGSAKDKEMARKLLSFKVKSRQMDFIEIGPDFKKKEGKDDGLLVFWACETYWKNSFNYKEYDTKVYDSSSDINALELARDRYYSGLTHDIEMTKQECEKTINDFLKKEVVF